MPQARSLGSVIIKQIPESRQDAPLIDLLHGLDRGDFVIRSLVTVGKKLFEGAFSARPGALITLQPGQSPQRFTILIVSLVIGHFKLP
jgi:hypothetical protein